MHLAGTLHRQPKNLTLECKSGQPMLRAFSNTYTMPCFLFYSDFTLALMGGGGGGDQTHQGGITSHCRLGWLWMLKLQLLNCAGEKDFRDSRLVVS